MRAPWEATCGLLLCHALPAGLRAVLVVLVGAGCRKRLPVMCARACACAVCTHLSLCARRPLQASLAPVVVWTGVCGSSALGDNCDAPCCVMRCVLRCDVMMRVRPDDAGPGSCKQGLLCTLEKRDGLRLCGTTAGRPRRAAAHSNLLLLQEAAVACVAACISLSVWCTIPSVGAVAVWAGALTAAAHSCRQTHQRTSCATYHKPITAAPPCPVAPRASFACATCVLPCACACAPLRRTAPCGAALMLRRC